MQPLSLIAPQDRIRFWRLWTVSCAAGELLGLALAAAVFVIADRRFDPFDSLGLKAAMVLAMLLAGILEGGTLGLLQWSALRRRFPTLPARRWIGVTALVAVLGWLAGSVGPVLHAGAPAAAIEEPVPLVKALYTLGFGVVAGALFGCFQWLVLRRYATPAGQWILANALGWGLGLPLIYLAAALPPAGTPLALIALLAAASGVLAGVSVGGITGGFLLRMTSLQEAAS